MLRQSLEICKKDIRSEIRTRFALNSLLMFVIVSISVVRFSLSELSLTPEIHSGLIWIIIFFSCSSGLARVFISEEERGTSLLLKLCADTDMVFTGKILFNISLTLVLSIFVVAFYIFVTDVVIGNFTLFMIIILSGCTGLSAAMTIVAAIISRSSSKGNLYPVLAFPVILPLLLSSVNGTLLSIEGADISAASSDLMIIFSFTVVITTASYMLFGFIWKD
jgi:heme exporter protein B